MSCADICGYCDRSYLDVLREYKEMYDEMAEKALQARLKNKGINISRATHADYQSWVTYERYNTEANTLGFVIRLLEGRCGCL